jgi:D-alanyl-D-alanine carboxypeptidase (penicillin-binding protein 5/6)
MVPIASLAKVMTAYLVLQASPLSDESWGFTLEITAQDVADTARRRSQDQSVVAVADGEHLTEREALEALLLPSANNIAAVLANLISGSLPAFVELMNDMAHSLHMFHTTYTDPSGFDPGTRSTAADQLLLARAAMSVPAFAALVAERSAVLPVAYWASLATI